MTESADSTIYDEPTPVETPPANGKPKRTLLNRLKGGETAPKPKETPKPVTPKRRRVAADELLTMGYGGMGAALVKSGRDIPVGRAMQFQAPVAGPILDRWVANRLFDRMVLQRLARQSKDLEAVYHLVSLPMVIAAWERKPEAGQVLEPIARAAIRGNLAAMVPVLRKVKKEEEEMAAILAELGPALDIPAGVDPVTAVLEAIFAPPPPGGEPNAADAQGSEDQAGDDEGLRQAAG